MKHSLLPTDKQYIACLIIATFCGFMTGGFVFISAVETTEQKEPAIVCAIMFAVQTAIFIGLAISYHVDSVRKAKEEANRNYLRNRN